MLIRKHIKLNNTGIKATKLNKLELYCSMLSFHTLSMYYLGLREQISERFLQGCPTIAFKC